MSAGAFVSSKYQADQGGIFRIRIQPETAVTTLGVNSNTAPSGSIDQIASARARGSKRRIGVTARTVTLKPVGSAPAGYKDGQSLVVPVLTPVVYNAVNLGDEATYLGVPYLVSGKSPERVR